MTAPERKSDMPVDAAWWRGAVIYQIYPRSFLDTNNDGVGDLKGVFEGLDYVASLGVDGVWLSPFFTSPMRDFGYDVADYRDVDPIFGALADFDHIIEKAHRLKLKIIIDQVYSHTSDQHTWFLESQQDKTNDKADWYVWADPRPDGTPPNNWQSVFGGGAWTWNTRRQQYYFHNFLTSQPDLNLHNIEVQDALLDVARFWLDRGVDGFRLDAINFCMHDPDLRDNPPADSDVKVRPFDYQDHIYNQSHPSIPTFLERIRKVTDEYGAIFTVAEIGGPDSQSEMKTFTSNNNRLNSAYDFAFLYQNAVTNEIIKKAVGEWRGGDGEGWPSWAFSNHDAPRVVSRWADEADRDKAARLFAMLLLSLRGNAFLYQGEELGLPQADVPFHALQDPEAIAHWPDTLGRDGARTPMPWHTDKMNAGFSKGQPWLPVDPNHLARAIDVQEGDEGSMLAFVRAMIEIRKSTPALRQGDITFVDAAEPLLAFHRKLDNDEVVCVFNITSADHSWAPPDNQNLEILFAAGLAPGASTPPATLQPLTGYIARKTS